MRWDRDDKVQQAARLLQTARHAVCLTGAGISTPSGIPDFRSPGSGLWEMADPMAVASIWGFMEHPEMFYNWIQPLARKIRDAQPNAAHYALAALERVERLRAVITQNIDGLHQRAGSKQVLEVHGHLREAVCVGCQRRVPSRALWDKFMQDGAVPRCATCGGAMKPSAVLFGETLPFEVMSEAQQAARRCDVMLIAGSSLEVVPAADLPLVALKAKAKLIIVNRTETGMDTHASVVMHADVAEVLPAIAEAVKRET